MAITTLNGVIAGMRPPESFLKVGVAVEAAGLHHSPLLFARHRGAAAAPTPLEHGTGDGAMSLAKLHPWMVLHGEQQHVTENYVSVPPALTLTDETGAIWTLGFQTAPMGRAPSGEFAFMVLRNGFETGVVASRLERRNGRVRAFTRDGWQVWNGNTFF